MTGRTCPFSLLGEIPRPPVRVCSFVPQQKVAIRSVEINTLFVPTSRSQADWGGCFPKAKGSGNSTQRSACFVNWNDLEGGLRIWFMCACITWDFSLGLPARTLSTLSLGLPSRIPKKMPRFNGGACGCIRYQFVPLKHHVNGEEKPVFRGKI